ncbi:hypothetical protein Hdeb2414_s0017g00512321 [Helianthus debilis subsp. tardiflorus]
MNIVKIFEAKLSVSIAKYDKNHQKFVYPTNRPEPQIWRPKVVPAGGGNGARGSSSNAAEVRTQPGRLYSDVVGGARKSQEHQMNVLVVNSEGQAFPNHCAGRSVLGTARSLRALSCTKQVLQDSGFNEVSVSYVGGLLMMLSFKDRSTANDFVATAGELWGSIFSGVKIWYGEDIPFDRVAILRIHGVPFQLRDNSLFDQIGSIFGEVVKPSEFSWESIINSGSKCGVLTKIGNRIEDQVVINWKNKHYQVWVLEEPVHWEPDFDFVRLVEASEFKDNSSVMPECGEMEEGEIRCNMLNPDNSGGCNAVRAVAEGVDTSEVGGVANQQSQNTLQGQTTCMGIMKDLLGFWK